MLRCETSLKRLHNEENNEIKKKTPNELTKVGRSSTSQFTRPVPVIMKNRQAQAMLRQIKETRSVLTTGWVVKLVIGSTT